MSETSSLIRREDIVLATAIRLGNDTLTGLERPIFRDDPELAIQQTDRWKLIRQAAVSEAAYLWFVARKQTLGADDGSVAYREAESDAMRLQLTADPEKIEAQFQAVDLLIAEKEKK